MCQRKFYKNRIKYFQTSSLDRATGGNGEGVPGVAPSSLVFPKAMFRGVSKNNSLFNY